MGSSVWLLDATYGHLVKGSEASARARPDTFTAELDKKALREEYGTAWDAAPPTPSA
jgi:hypothetical protein